MSWECLEYPKNTALVLGYMSWKNGGHLKHQPDVHRELNVWNVWSKYNTCLGNVWKVWKRQGWCSGKCSGKMQNFQSICGMSTSKLGAECLDAMHVSGMCRISKKYNCCVHINTSAKSVNSGASISAQCAQTYWLPSIWNNYTTCMYKCNMCCRNMWEVKSLKVHIPQLCICPRWIWNLWTIKGDICKICQGMVSHNRNPFFVENSEVESAQEVFILNIPGTFITFYIHVGCCMKSISHFLATLIWTPVLFGIFISDISNIQQLIYVCTCSGSSEFLWDICPSTRVVFFSDIPDTLRTWITICKFISDISDIQQLIYFCTCCGRSAFFQDIWGLFSFGYSGHSQDMYYSWQIYFG